MSATPAAPAPVMMEKAKEQLWLLKVPNFVMEHLQSVQEADVDLGTLTQDEEGAAAGGASSSSGSGRSFTLKLSDSAKLLPDVPRELSVTLGAPAAPMHVVSEPKETSKGGAWRLEGKIVQKGEAKPKTLTQEYKNIWSPDASRPPTPSARSRRGTTPAAAVHRIGRHARRPHRCPGRTGHSVPPNPRLHCLAAAAVQGKLTTSKADRDDKKMRAVMKRQKTDAKPAPLRWRRQTASCPAARSALSAARFGCLSGCRLPLPTIIPCSNAFTCNASEPHPTTYGPAPHPHPHPPTRQTANPQRAPPPLTCSEEQIRDTLFDEFARKQFASRFELMQTPKLSGQKQASTAHRPGRGGRRHGGQCDDGSEGGEVSEGTVCIQSCFRPPK